jgi:hypothetical protein
MSGLTSLPARIITGIVIAAALIASSAHYRQHVYQQGHDAAVAERVAVDAVAVLRRTQDNAELATQQTQINTTIAQEKDNEIIALRARLAAAPRLRVGTAVCPDRSAGSAQAESPTGSDSADSSGRLVSAPADRDFKQLIKDVEQDLATGRACQAFLVKNGLVP